MDRRAEEQCVRGGRHYCEADVVRTFLLCTIPSLCPPGMRAFSSEILQVIAKFAYCPQYKPALSVSCDLSQIEACKVTSLRDGLKIDMSKSSDIDITSSRITLKPIRNGIQYVDFTINNAWNDTQVRVHDITLLFTDSDQDDVDEEEIVVLFNATGERCLRHVSAWARSWFWDYRVRVGIEVDMYRGSVTWSLNGIMGPRTPLGDNWERGVDISVAGVSNEIIYSDDDAEKERATIYVRSNRLPRGMHLLEHGNGFCRARDITTGVSCFCGHEEWLRKCLANCEELK